MKLKTMTVALTVALAVVACDSASTGPNGGQAPMSLSLMVPVGGPAPSAARLLADGELRLTDGINELTITSVQIVLSEIELERAESVAGCDDDEDEIEGSEDDSCEELQLGPRTIDLSLDGSVVTGFTVDVEPGTYEEIEFEIVSVIVDYTWNGGAPSTFTTDVDAEIEQEFPDPGLVIEPGNSYNVTLSIDVLTWFMDGTTVIDPSTALPGGENEELVRDNIENSFESYEDDDHDGVPHDEDDDEDDEDDEDDS
ncbi:MAG: hypothetical protein JSU87_01025 [Gemmatimonadota bacterium]|nr:MAG: hypothetical protein JSU87_01025 [Gemmatimonadota bacterium]